MNQTPPTPPAGPDQDLARRIQRLHLTTSNGRFDDHPFTDLGLEILQTGNIAGPDEGPGELLHRIYCTLLDSDNQNGFSDDLYRLLATGAFVLSTPILTNAGRYDNKPLSACTVPSLDWGRERHSIESHLTQLRLGGMGTGFNFDELDDPITMIKKINDLSVRLQASGQQDRPVGNMGVLSVYHPHIFDYVTLKTWEAGNGISCFNISVNIDAAFMQAVQEDSTITLWDGREVKARELMYAIAEAAHNCADPGLVFLDRMNADNPTPLLAAYTATAPCGEVGLAPGETCQFGSLNLGLFVDRAFETDAMIDYGRLQTAVYAMVRTLDNALETSIQHYDPQSAQIMNAKRKIGVGVCGFADMLLQLGVVYGSPQSLALANTVMSFINYHSKVASVELAKERGSFGAFSTSRYMSGDDLYFLSKYEQYTTSHVTTADRQGLKADIRRYGIRHASTTALPPTGRSALLYGASQQIEPYFMICDNRGTINPLLLRLLRHRGVTDTLQQQICREKSLQALQDTSRSDIPPLCVTALNLDPLDHLAMVAAFQANTDEAVSKTVNLPGNCSVDDVMDIYMYARELGLKGITIYRQGSMWYEPMKLS